MSDKQIISTNPKDIIIVYRDEHFMYGTKQLKKLQNVHFHITPSCITKQYPDFQEKDLHIPSDLKPLLSAEQKGLINSLLGIQV